MAERLLELTEHLSSAMLNWREIVKEIDAEWRRASTEEQRVSLLAMFKATMDVAETTIALEDLATFKDARAKHYSSFIVEEALVGSHVCVETLFAVTAREVAAGRMAEDHALRQAAVQGMAAPHLSRAQLEAQAATPKLASTSKSDLLASIEQLRSQVIAAPAAEMADAIKAVPDQDFSAEEWRRVVDFSAFQIALWQCEWLFSSAKTPDANAREEAEQWGRLWEVFVGALVEKVPGVNDALLRQRNLVVAHRQLQRKTELDRRSAVARFLSALLGGVAMALNRAGFVGAAQSLYKRALYPAGTVGREAG